MEQTTEGIYLEFYKKIKNFIYGSVSNKSHVDDIVHDVFLKIHMNLEKVKDFNKIESWIFQIARNTMIDYYRKLKHCEELREDYPIVDEIPDESEGSDIISQGIRAIINLLPPKYSEALVLTNYSGLTQKELAAKIGLSIPAAKSRVQRGRELFKAKLFEFCHFEFDRFGNVLDYQVKKCPVCHREKQNNLHPF